MELKLIEFMFEDNLEFNEKVDNFIMDKSTNGEFINTVKYLSYHRDRKFSNEHVVIIDRESSEILAVCLAPTDV